MFMFTPNQIRVIRRALDMNSTEFASLLGVTVNAVARWEIGDRHPRQRTLVKLNDVIRKHKITVPIEMVQYPLKVG